MAKRKNLKKKAQKAIFRSGLSSKGINFGVGAANLRGGIRM